MGSWKNYSPLKQFFGIARNVPTNIKNQWSKTPMTVECLTSCVQIGAYPSPGCQNTVALKIHRFRWITSSLWILFFRVSFRWCLFRKMPTLGRFNKTSPHFFRHLVSAGGYGAKPLAPGPYYCQVVEFEQLKNGELVGKNHGMKLFKDFCSWKSLNPVTTLSGGRSRQRTCGVVALSPSWIRLRKIRPLGWENLGERQITSFERNLSSKSTTECSCIKSSIRELPTSVPWN